MDNIWPWVTSDKADKNLVVGGRISLRKGEAKLGAMVESLESKRITRRKKS